MIFLERRFSRARCKAAFAFAFPASLEAFFLSILISSPLLLPLSCVITALSFIDNLLFSRHFFSLS